MSAATAPKCNEIGNLFASQYYRHLVSSPDTAHNFYHAEAGFSRLRGSAPSEQIVGHEKIKAYIASYNFQSYKLKIDTIDSQEKGKNEIIVLVSGIEIDEDKVVRPFCQTFCLEAISGTRYLVRNDILCYLRSELLNIGDQKVEAQPEMLESNAEESVEQKEEQSIPVHVDMGTHVDLSNLETIPTKEEPQPPTPQPVEEQLTQIPASQTPKQPKPSTRADTKREVADPSKPRAWSSVVGGATSGGLPGQSIASSSTSESVNSPEPEEEIVTTPSAATTAQTPVDKPKPAPRSEVLNSLYVSNFEPGCDVEEIKELFSRFGKVKAVKYTPSQSYCFVDYESAESADKALKGGQLRLGDFDLKLERRKTPTFNSARGRGGRGARGGRGRGGPPRDPRPEPRTDRTERREPRPREGNDRSGGNRSHPTATHTPKTH
jgi:hypothetical protein